MQALFRWTSQDKTARGKLPGGFELVSVSATCFDMLEMFPSLALFPFVSRLSTTSGAMFRELEEARDPLVVPMFESDGLELSPLLKVHG